MIESFQAVGPPSLTSAFTVEGTRHESMRCQNVNLHKCKYFELIHFTLSCFYLLKYSDTCRFRENIFNVYFRLVAVSFLNHFSSSVQTGKNIFLACFFLLTSSLLDKFLYIVLIWTHPKKEPLRSLIFHSCIPFASCSLRPIQMSLPCISTGDYTSAAQCFPLWSACANRRRKGRSECTLL